MANKALSLDPSQVRAHVILGRIHIFYQRYDQAKAALDRAIATNPNDAHALAGRGNVLMWLGQTDAAIEALERAQRLDPELNAIDRFALSLAYYSSAATSPPSSRPNAICAIPRVRASAASCWRRPMPSTIGWTMPRVSRR